MTRPATLKEAICTHCKRVRLARYFQVTRYKTLNSWCEACIRDMIRESWPERKDDEKQKRLLKKKQREQQLKKIAQQIIAAREPEQDQPTGAAALRGE